MQLLQGIAASPGVAIGEALVFSSEGFQIPRRFVMRDAVDDELQRLELAIEAAVTAIQRDRDTVTRQLGEQYGAIFSAHAQMLRDAKLHDELEKLIREQHYSPEYAVSCTMRRYAKVFRELDNDYLAERAHDIFDLEKTLLGTLLGKRREGLAHISSPVIVLAHDLTPSETAVLNPAMVLAFVTEIGGAGGHTAIVAKGLEIPGVVGAGRFLTDVSGGDCVIVDGDHGVMIIDPDPPTLQRYRREAEQHRNLQVRLGELRDLPAVTVDGVPITLAANIEFPHEVEACLRHGAVGVGLYRTEFLYLGAESEPSEEDHFLAYKRVIETLGQRPIVIRTLDLGADKMGQLPHAEEEQNPFLGMRSIRLSLRNLSVFRTQLRAILRASSLGQIRIMFPLIATLHELRRARLLLEEVMEDLREEGQAFNAKIQVGMMVEVPSTVVLLDRYLHEVDFISIGTNDLIQYALAVDRSNKDVADLYRAGDPAVLNLIDQSLRAAQRAEIPASVCGQMSESPAYSLLLLGLGLRGFSVPPSAVPEIKKIVRSVTVAQCQEIAHRALSMDSAQEVDALLQQELRRLAPELVLSQ